MHVLLTGAGQIGSALVPVLLAAGDRVTVLRRSGPPLPGTQTLHGDAGDRDLLHRLAETDPPTVVLHTIHSLYDHRAWRAELPDREQAVMDLAVSLGIPVVFPESVYAWGHGASDLPEGTPPSPCSPLGEVRTDWQRAQRTRQ